MVMVFQLVLGGFGWFLLFYCFISCLDKEVSQNLLKPCLSFRWSLESSNGEKMGRQHNEKVLQ